MALSDPAGSSENPGLIHPRSLERWQEWQASRQRLRRAKHAIHHAITSRRRGAGSGAAGAGSAARGDAEPTGLVLHSRAGSAAHHRVLLGVDSASPTSRAALLTALPYLSAGVDVITPADVTLPELAGPDWERQEIREDLAPLTERGIGAVMTLGQHLRAGRAVHAWALGADVPAAVVQHGALTPFAPPLPEQTTLLAWSEADGEFYRSGREDVAVRVVGSQMLWQAGHHGDEETPGTKLPATGADGEAPDGDAPAHEQRPVFLGQMHGAELPRRITARTAYEFCRREGALYRPHPAETDVLSRGAHRLMRRVGIEIQDPSAPLIGAGAPVVAVFSTGVLEAAVRGIPAFVTATHTPAWLREFWERYDMRRWGFTEPTPAPAVPADEPARVIAQALEGSGA